MKLNSTLKLYALLSLISVLSLSCEREISDSARIATFPTTPAIFEDNPVDMGDNFYFPYDGSFAEAWSVDNKESFEGEASMRFDIPNADNPKGSFGGAIFRTDSSPRNLTSYDALTFWARASQGVMIGEFGLGEDFFENRFQTTLFNKRLGTAWEKVIIPLPDPSRLTEELGLFRYSAGSNSTGGNAYTFWIDDLKFENLGTIAQPRPSIQNGQDVVSQSFIGGNLQVSNLRQTYNTTEGDVTTAIAPAFFIFSSSDESVARVNEQGRVDVVGSGTAEITASIGGNEARGSLIVESLGEFTPAPTPTRDPQSVISLFSNTYQNRPVDFYNGFYEPFQTTTSADFEIDGDQVLYYLNFNFVGIEFNQNVPVINGSLATHLHFDIFIPVDPPANTGLRIDLVDFGPDQSFGGGDDTTLSQNFTSGFVSGEWISIDFDITGLNPRNNLGQIILADVNGRTPPSEFYVDNIYFYREDGGNINP